MKLALHNGQIIMVNPFWIGCLVCSNIAESHEAKIVATYARDAVSFLMRQTSLRAA